MITTVALRAGDAISSKIVSSCCGEGRQRCVSPGDDRAVTNQKSCQEFNEAQNIDAIWKEKKHKVGHSSIYLS